MTTNNQEPEWASMIRPDAVMENEISKEFPSEPEAQTNRKGVAAQSDVFIEEHASQRSNPAMALLEIPADVDSYTAFILRMVLAGHEPGLITRLTSRARKNTTGRTDIVMDLFTKVTANVAVGGLGRNQYLEGLTAQTRRSERVIERMRGMAETPGKKTSQ